MVKRLRRRPLTAKTGVRVPVGLPKKRAQVLPVHAFLVLRKEGEPRPHEKPSGAAPTLSGVGSRSSAARTLRQRRKPHVGYPYLGGENHARTKSRAEPHLPYRASVRVRAQRELCAKGARPTVGGARREPRPHEKPSGAAPTLSGVGSRSSAARTLRQRRKPTWATHIWGARTTPARKAERSRTCPVGRRFAFERNENFAPTAQDPPWGGKARTTPARKAERSRTCPVGRRFAFERSENFAPTAQAPRGGQTRTTPARKAERRRTCPVGRRFAFERSENFAPKAQDPRGATHIWGARTTPARKAERGRTCPVGRRFAFERSENFAPTAQAPPWGANENHARTKSRAEPHLPCRASVRVRAQRELCAKGARPTVWGQGENHARTKSRAEPHLPYRASVRVRAQRELCAPRGCCRAGRKHKLFSHPSTRTASRTSSSPIVLPPPSTTAICGSSARFTSICSACEK